MNSQFAQKFQFPWYIPLTFPFDLLYSADAGSDGSLERFNQQIKVTSDGQNLWLAPIILLSSCKIHVKYFPFDEQHCELKFGSWTFDGFHLDLLPEAPKADIGKFALNGEWELIEVLCKRNVIKYVCCDAPYPDITYTVRIRRRTLFFFFNMVIPCLVIVGKIFSRTGALGVRKVWKIKKIKYSKFSVKTHRESLTKGIFCKRFQPRSHFISSLSIIVRLNVVLNTDCF